MLYNFSSGLEQLRTLLHVRYRTNTITLYRLTLGRTGGGLGGGGGYNALI